MEVPTGSGTEVLKAHSFDDAHGTVALIIGVQHHTYTVINSIACAVSLGSESDTGTFQITGNGNFASGTGHAMRIAVFNITAGQTFVMNDKFVFFGAEPAAYTEPMSDAAEQVSIAAQGSSTVQTYQLLTTDSAAIFDVHVAFIDQDWT